jgi:hypothetical protein
VSSDIGVFNKGSIMQSIIELEAGLLEKENEAQDTAGEIIREATLSGKKLHDDTMKELSLIEVEERKKLADEVDAKTEKLKGDEDRSIKDLERTIDANGTRALEFILKNVIPGWDGSIPG